jgi:preprotein translocase subunit SecA
MSILAKIFDVTRKDLRRMWPMARRITALEPQMQALADAQLRAKSDEFRARLADGETLDDILIEAFAVVREAAVRTVGLRPFDVQLIGGIVLHEGKIGEMKTGEGKTLVATMPLYLNALTGKGAHLVTHNDYLAKRDREWMGPIYEFLGLTVGMLQHDIEDPALRRASYMCDIAYGMSSEFGFDYLRDNRASTIEEVVQRELNYAIVDEVDSLLVDEARVPLILAGPGTKPAALYQRVDRVVRQLKRDQDYVVDEKAKVATLTDVGMERAERLLSITNLSDLENAEVFSHVNAALRAHACYHLDVDYVVREGQAIIVDEFTGRLMFGRRYAEGLHQAIEAKEGVKIERESQTIATITVQNYFRLYEKLAGMTGTAKTEEQEFVKIYGMPVVVIPTHKPMIRTDNPDAVYKTEEAKFRGITGEILQLKSRGQPVLVGTRSIQVSESLSDRLKPAKLQLFAQLTLLHDQLSDIKSLNDAQQRELEAVLRERLAITRRERRELEKATEHFDQSPARMVRPDELQQIERRLRRVGRVEEDLQAIIEKLNKREGLGGGELHRMADLITFQQLEDVPAPRIALLTRACGLNADPTAPGNLEALAARISLEGNLEELATALREGIPHQVLNAKYHEQEAKIIANAGRSDTVTIATNMAGRGVDILLGGNPQRIAQDWLEANGGWENATEEQRAEALAKGRQMTEQDRQRVLAVKGLHILGTERHEARRIDNQLRGRSGRQGDPGTSRFYVSMQDELMRLFAPERFDFLLSRWNECEPVEARLVSGSIENAQRKVEAMHFSSRQHILKYDDVRNLQREVIYRQRRRVLEGADLKDSVLDGMRSFVERQAKEFASPEIHPDDWNLQGLYDALFEIFPIHQYAQPDDLRARKTFPELVEYLQGLIVTAYEDRDKELGAEVLRDLERRITLYVIDTKWIDHLDAMDYLEEGIGLRGYAGVDPVIAFQKESYDYWLSLQQSIQEDLVRYLFRVQIVREQPKRPEYHEIHASGGDGDEEPPQPVKVGRKVGRNDPCPCGSGKKYKKCCMAKAA